jgi:hypothetical protein
MCNGYASEKLVRIRESSGAVACQSTGLESSIPLRRGNSFVASGSGPKLSRILQMLLSS